MADLKIVKRDGSKEDFKIEKIHKVVSWAIEGLTNVEMSDIEINAKLNIIDGITTKQIHSVIIDSAANLINEDNPDYQYVAGRLLNYQMRKEVWGGKNPPKLFDLIKSNIKKEYYTPNILKWYTQEEINKIDEFVNHDVDFSYTYCSTKQLSDKYLVKNQETKELHETPQFRYIIAALSLFHNYKGQARLNIIKRVYNYFSKFKINLATPQLAGLGTNNNSFSSCCLLEMLDTADSINAANNAVAKATCAGYGIGINFGRMRAINAPVKNGTILHPGVVPFLKIAEANTKAWQKNGVRGGSATVNFPIWHYEIENILQLKNATTGTNDSRVFNLDYAIGISKLFYERFLKNESFTLFSPAEVPGLYDAFGTEKFDELYCTFEKDDKIKQKQEVKARDLFSLLVKERLESGRIYILNVDNVNNYGSWLEKVNMTNLCLSGETILNVCIEDENSSMIKKLSLKECVELVKNGKLVKVLSKNLDENKAEFKQVLDGSMTYQNAEVIKVEDTESGKYLICTPNHEIYTKNRSYVQAKDLKEDDILDFGIVKL